MLIGLVLVSYLLVRSSAWFKFHSELGHFVAKSQWLMKSRENHIAEKLSNASLAPLLKYEQDGYELGSTITGWLQSQNFSQNVSIVGGVVSQNYSTMRASGVDNMNIVLGQIQDSLESICKQLSVNTADIIRKKILTGRLNSLDYDQLLDDLLSKTDFSYLILLSGLFLYCMW